MPAAVWTASLPSGIGSFSLLNLAACTSTLRSLEFLSDWDLIWRSFNDDLASNHPMTLR